ncbi:MAG: hypothetical protein GX132_01380 [Erysipelotrichia bacterium]|nr:hypothetical protein [Erysipelotrichia bacterium]
MIACDEELVLQYRKNSKEAYDFLLKRKLYQHRPLLYKYYYQCKCYGGTMADIHSLFYETFHKAVLRFIYNKILFNTYFLKLLNRDLAGYFRYLKHPCRSPNTFLSFDQEINYDLNLTFYDVLNCEEQKNDCRNFINVQAVMEILDELPINKKDFETRNIIFLKSYGYTVPEIAVAINLNAPAVRRRIKDFYTSELGERIRQHLL